ncbi:MAG: hypothetical protein J5585_06860 [Clostridia bacterium]|nr:hypothetical protein [Clostridia bacterium]
MDDSLKKQAIFSELEAFLELKSFNAKNLPEDVLITIRIEMDQAEKIRFYDKHLKNTQVSVLRDGTVILDIKNRIKGNRLIRSLIDEKEGVVNYADICKINVKIIGKREKLCRRHITFTGFYDIINRNGRSRQL